MRVSLQAHFYARKAESFLKVSGSEKFESISYLDKCIDCLEQSLNLTSSSKAIESIKLQRNHHIKQRNLIQHLFDKYNAENQKPINVQLNERVINSNKIQLDLFENIDGTDSLLEDLKKSNPESQIAAELQQMNSQLNVLLFQLITQLDETVQENDALKEKLKTLDAKASDNYEFRKIEAIQDELRLSTDAFEAHEEFAPLELPVFDLDTLETPKH